MWWRWRHLGYLGGSVRGPRPGRRVFGGWGVGDGGSVERTDCTGVGVDVY